MVTLRGLKLKLFFVGFFCLFQNQWTCVTSSNWYRSFPTVKMSILKLLELLQAIQRRKHQPEQLWFLASRSVGGPRIWRSWWLTSWGERPSKATNTWPTVQGGKQDRDQNLSFHESDIQKKHTQLCDVRNKKLVFWSTSLICRMFKMFFRIFEKPLQFPPPKKKGKLTKPLLNKTFSPKLQNIPPENPALR